MGRFKLLLAYFMAILLALSVTQAIIDARIEASLNIDALDRSNTYSIFIEIEDKTLYLLQNGKRIKEYRIASGKSGLPSPLGTWTIVEKGIGARASEADGWALTYPGESMASMGR